MEISKLNGQMDATISSQNQRIGTTGTNLNTAQDVRNLTQDIQTSSNQQKNGQKESLNKQLNDVVKELNQQMDSLNTNVRFGFSDDISSMYITVSEKNTGREIRQIPSEEAIKLTKYFRDAIGLIFDKES